jgi:hypothetical protein
MFVTHSSLRTTGYASTTETANYLTWRLGGSPQLNTSVSPNPLGLERLSTYSKGNFHMRGFAGGGAADHCAQMGLMRDVLRVHIKPRFEQNPPKPAPATPESVPGTPEPQAPSEVASLGASHSL